MSQYSLPPSKPSPSSAQGHSHGSETQIPGPPGYATVQAPAGKPWITYTFMGIAIVIYLLQMASQTLFGIDYPAALGMKVNEVIIQGQLWRFLTPMFLHGSILHLGFNMYALFIFGPGLERHYGHGRFLALLILSGFAGNVVSFIFTSANSLGSSTAIFGLVGAQGVFFYQNRAIFGRIGQRALINILTIAGINLLIGLSPGIDNWGHIGGLLGGTLFAWIGGPVLQVQGAYPMLSLEDERETAQIVAAGAGVLILFGIFAIIKIFTQS
jgi:rhomboid protease GluP